ncbi:hypothetical protein C2845_PM10G02970 [Panicum miliaceum]|uniref:Uncharacterized protein n=1 Tax=Panicum miliaceum TaxID=4540 RepID=A0A3L6PCH2_PANMI|nr:hypothetical protein C2845_PM10G02970 [Panicum miliaceum]
MACRVAALVLLLALAVALVASPPPCAAAARVRLLADVPRAGGEAPGYDKTDGSATGSGFRGSPPGFDGGRTTPAAGNAAARVLGSVPSPGVGH